jgi:hypothetical protein
MQSGSPEDAPQVLVNSRQLIVCEIGDLAVRPNARLETDLVRILVPDARHDLFIHQEALESAPAPTLRQMNEPRCRELLAERIKAEVVQEAEAAEIVAFEKVNVPSRAA